MRLTKIKNKNLLILSHRIEGLNLKVSSRYENGVLSVNSKESSNLNQVNHNIYRVNIKRTQGEKQQEYTRTRYQVVIGHLVLLKTIKSN